MLNKHWLVTLAFCSLLSVASRAQISRANSQQTFEESCSNKPFLTVSVSVPKRDTIPRTQLRLADPSSRQQGAHLTGKSIPNSRYENVIEIPEIPNRSRAHAIEVCEADQGKYKVTIYEHADELYRLTVRIGLGEALTAVLRPREDRIREFSFVFKQKNNGTIYLTWLDRNDRPSLYLDMDQ